MHRTPPVRNSIRGAVFAGLVFWLGLATPVFAQDNPPRQDTPLRQVLVPRGGTINLQLSTKKAISGAETDTQGIVRLALSKVDLTVLLITGENPGKVLLTVTDKDGGKEQFDLLVQSDVEYLRYVLNRVLPTADIEPIPSANNAFVLTGTVERPEDLPLALATAQSVVGNNVINALRVRAVAYLKNLMHQAVPTANVDLIPSANNSYILTGTVARNEDVPVVLTTAQSALGNNIINALRVGGVQEVQLDVIIALVDRSRARNIGFSFIDARQTGFLSSSVSGGGNLTSNFLTFPTGQPNVNASQIATPNIIFGILTAGTSFTGYLNALRTEAVAKTLAEPKLVTLDGKPATFVSGGEQAVPTLASGSAGGGAVSGVNFVPFGTTVRFLPIIQGNGMIYLEVEPQVTFPSGNAAIASPISGSNGTVAGRTTQRLQTAVMIEDGQTLAIGGLIQKTSNVTTTKVPVLGDLPYVGALFRSTNDTEDDQELLILVTPHLVDPMSCKQLPKFLPTQESRRPDDFELFLEGILEAPRGPRQTVKNDTYVPAFHNSSTILELPCGSPNGGHGAGKENSCASGQCHPGGFGLGIFHKPAPPPAPPVPQTPPPPMGFNGNGVPINGNGNGVPINGNGNGNGMPLNGNGNGNGVPINGNGHGMPPNGNGVPPNGNGVPFLPSGNGVPPNGNGMPPNSYVVPPNGNGVPPNGNRLTPVPQVPPAQLPIPTAPMLPPAPVDPNSTLPPVQLTPPPNNNGGTR